MAKRKKQPKQAKNKYCFYKKDEERQSFRF